MWPSSPIGTSRETLITALPCHHVMLKPQHLWDYHARLRRLRTCFLLQTVFVLTAIFLLMVAFLYFTTPVFRMTSGDQARAFCVPCSELKSGDSENRVCCTKDSVQEMLDEVIKARMDELAPREMGMVLNGTRAAVEISLIVEPTTQGGPSDEGGERLSDWHRSIDSLNFKFHKSNHEIEVQQAGMYLVYCQLLLYQTRNAATNRWKLYIQSSHHEVRKELMFTVVSLDCAGRDCSQDKFVPVSVNGLVRLRKGERVFINVTNASNVYRRLPGANHLGLIHV